MQVELFCVRKMRKLGYTGRCNGGDELHGEGNAKANFPILSGQALHSFPTPFPDSLIQFLNSGSRIFFQRPRKVLGLHTLTQQHGSWAEGKEWEGKEVEGKENARGRKAIPSAPNPSSCPTTVTVTTPTHTGRAVNAHWAPELWFLGSTSRPPSWEWGGHWLLSSMMSPASSVTHLGTSRKRKVLPNWPSVKLLIGHCKFSMAAAKYQMG